MKMVILFFLFLFSCSQTENHGFENIQEVIIKYLDWDLLTYIRVDCNKIETYSKEMKIITVQDTSFISKLNNELKSLKEIKTDAKPDVRIKLEIKFINKSSILCIGNNKIIEFNGKKVNYNEQLIEMIRNYIKFKEFKEQN